MKKTADRRVVNLAGRSVAEESVQTFGSSLRGELLRPGDSGYDSGRRVWNGMIDRHPALIAYCREVEDVIRSVNFARENELLTAVRSGGHNVSGNCVCDGGIVIDLSRMKEIRVDPASRTARAHSGLNWGEFDRETQRYGLATTGGIVSRTGIAGLTLGGGIGWLMRKFGVTCDNLLSVDIVTAEGKLVTANADENKDLFWGVRGGGGNFGIASGFEYRLHEVGPVLAGTICYPASGAREILKFYRDFIINIPDELTTMFAYIAAPPSPLRQVHDSSMAAIHVCYSGPVREGEELVKPLRAISRPIRDTVRAMPYVELQSMFDSGAPPGLLNYWKSSYLGDLGNEAIDAFCACCESITSPLSQVHLQQMQGAVGRRGEDEMAFSHRDSLCVLNIVTKWEDQAGSERHINWTREFEAAMRPFSTGGVYLNFLGEEGDDRVRAAYSPEKYRRLQKIKQKYDPANLFRMNQNIRPTGPYSNSARTNSSGTKS